MKRKALFLLTIAVLLLAGCAAGEVAPAGSAGDGATGSGADAPAEVTAVSLWLDDTAVNECFSEVVAATFDSETTTIEFNLISDNYWDAIRTGVNGGAGPDVVFSPGPSFAFEMAQAGLLAPLSGYAESLGWDDVVVDWALSLGTVDGELYSLPSEQETMVLYYNQTLFDENGWEVPTTIDELMALSETIAAAGIDPFAHGNADWRPANEWFFSAIVNNVAGPENVYAALTGEKPWTDPEFIEAIAVLNEMQQNGWFSGGLDLYYTTDGDGRLAAFGAGEAAMNIEGSWRLENINTFFGEEAGNSNDWAWIPVPSESGEPTFSIGVGSTYSINSFSEHPDQAAEVISHIFNPETQAQLVVQCGMGPAPVRLEAEMLDGLDERNASLYAAIGQASDAGNYGYLTWTFWPPRSDVYIYEEIEKMWNDDISPEEYAAGLQEVFAEELAAGEIPPIPER